MSYPCVWADRQACDLHGFSVQDSRKKLNEIFSNPNLSQLTIVTGHGKHSKNGFSPLYQVVVPNFIYSQPNIRAVEKDYKGAYVVTFSESDQEKNDFNLFKQHLIKLAPEIDQEKLADIKSKSQINNLERLGLHYYYLKNEDEKEALHWLKEAASHDHPFAQGYLGCVYESGYYGVQLSHKKAFKWYEKGANNNDPLSLYQLANCYWLGKMVVKNARQAVGCLEKAATRFPHAAARLALILLNGAGDVSPEPKRSKKLFQIAAKANLVWAQVMLALQTFYGWGISQNDSKAFQWFEKAGKTNDPTASFYLGLMYIEGRHVEKKPEKACQWLKKAADAGNLNAQYFLTCFQLIGKGIKKDVSAGIATLKQLAKNNHLQSNRVLGLAYLHGYEEIKQNRKLATRYLKRASQLDPEQAEKRLAYDRLNQARELLKISINNPKAIELLEKSLILEGAKALLGRLLLNTDAKRGIELLKEVAKQNNIFAQYELGEYFIFQNKKELDLEAVSYFASAARNGHSEAMFWLAICYHNERGVKHNLEQCKHWLNQAIVSSDPRELNRGLTLFLQEVNLTSNKELHAAAISSLKKISDKSTEAIKWLQFLSNRIKIVLI